MEGRTWTLDYALKDVAMGLSKAEIVPVSPKVDVADPLVMLIGSWRIGFSY